MGTCSRRRQFAEAPELAGDGIEYCWGKGKYEFRHLNDGVPKHLQDNIWRALDPTEVLFPLRVRKFARKTRSYKRAYREIAGGGGTVAQHAEIERHVKKVKAHRSCSQDTAWLKVQ